MIDQAKEIVEKMLKSIDQPALLRSQLVALYDLLDQMDSELHFGASVDGY